jgi:hypothetical protein
VISWHKRRWQCRQQQCERGSFTEQIAQIPALMVIRRHKRRWQCRQQQCERGSFTEQIAQIPALMRLTERLWSACGQAVADGGRTVVQAGRGLGPTWPVVMRATRTYADQVLPDAPPASEAIGIDETRRGRAVWKQNDDGSGSWSRTPGTSISSTRWADRACSGRSRDAMPLPLPPGWKPSRPGGARRSATSPSTCAPPSAPPCAHATVVVDAFHVVQLAQRHLADLRRRLTWKQHGRRARPGDAIYTVRQLLRRNKRTSPPSNMTS